MDSSRRGFLCALVPAAVTLGSAGAAPAWGRSTTPQIPLGFAPRSRDGKPAHLQSAPQLDFAQDYSKLSSATVALDSFIAEDMTAFYRVNAGLVHHTYVNTGEPIDTHVWQYRQDSMINCGGGTRFIAPLAAGRLAFSLEVQTQSSILSEAQSRKFTVYLGQRPGGGVNSLHEGDYFFPLLENQLTASDWPQYRASANQISPLTLAGKALAPSFSYIRLSIAPPTDRTSAGVAEYEDATKPSSTLSRLV